MNMLTFVTVSSMVFNIKSSNLHNVLIVDYRICKKCLIFVINKDIHCILQNTETSISPLVSI